MALVLPVATCGQSTGYWQACKPAEDSLALQEPGHPLDFPTHRCCTRFLRPLKRWLLAKEQLSQESGPVGPHLANILLPVFGDHASL